MIVFFFFFVITLLSFSGKAISACLFTQIILAANSDELDEKAKAPVVQQKGRFKVTSENVDFEKVIFTIPDLIFLFCEADFPPLFQVVPSPVLQKSHSMQVRLGFFYFFIFLSQVRLG